MSWTRPPLVPLTLAAGLSSCGPSATPGGSSPGDAREVRLLALGDSYTIGEGVAATERWPTRLAERLREAGRQVAEPVVIAKTGWTTSELLAAVEAAELAPPHDVVTLAVGVNDQYRGHEAESFRADFRRALERAIGLAGGRPARVVATTIPDWGRTPFAEGRDRSAIREGIARYNAVVEEETERAGVALVDVGALTDAAAARPDGLVADGLHYSASTHQRWAQAVEPAVRAALERGTEAGG